MGVPQTQAIIDVLIDLVKVHSLRNTATIQTRISASHSCSDEEQKHYSDAIDAYQMAVDIVQRPCQFIDGGHGAYRWGGHLNTILKAIFDLL